ncbi:hypothetical protein EV175_000226 [Coemansia sp. RSA 1933]|nr:hypothetical protein EV175_000226 [Coemansia sp. RSA 1933]
MVKIATIFAAGAIALSALVGGAPVDASGPQQARRHYNAVNSDYASQSPTDSSGGPRTVTVTVDRYVSQLPGGGYTTMTSPPSGYSNYASSSPAYSAAPSPQYSSSGSSYTSDWRQQMLSQVNAVRAQAGRPALTINQQLNTMAQEQSDYQASVSTMTHDNPDGSLGSRCSSVGIKWSGVAENVAWNYPDVTSVVQGWVNSPGHYENMVGDYNVVGFAVNDKYWTQDFAKI